MRDSDATVLFTLSAQPTGGSLLTWNEAAALGKPRLHLSAAVEEPHAEILLRFLQAYQVAELNIAGPRASTEPDIGRFVTRVLDEALLDQGDPEADSAD
ncbi:MAG: putative molybdenum carrier [Verrucomicrobia bacterium]|nr:MAG: putative molybdenum carrier [Verrucomicrobiota bacterium]